MDEPSITVSRDGEVDLPLVEVMTGRGFITGTSGSGKSNSVGVTAEEILEHGYAIVIIDIEGEHYGLKEDYEALHVGAGEECDLVVGPEHSGKIAELALDKNIPIILDISEYIDTDERDELVKETLSQLFQKEKEHQKPLPVFVEEAHEFIPQQGSVGEVGEMIIRVGKRGRKRGLGIVGISQRPANVDKNFISQANFQIWHQLDWDNDREVLRKQSQSREIADGSKELDPGQAFLYTNWDDNEYEGFTNYAYGRVQMRRKNTYDAGDTPGLEETDRPELKSVSEDLIDELEEISERKSREEDKIAQLQRRLEEKDEYIRDLEEKLEEARDLSQMAEEFTMAMSGVDTEEVSQRVEEEINDIKEVKDNRIEELEEEVEEKEEEVEELREKVSELKEYRDAVEDVKEFRERQQELEEIHSRLGSIIGRDDTIQGQQAGERVSELKERVRELESEKRELEEKLEEMAPEESGVKSLIQHDAIQEAVDIAAEDTNYKREHYDKILKVFATSDEGFLDAGDVSPMLSVSRNTVSRVMKSLNDSGILLRQGSKGKGYEYKLNEDFLEKRVRVHKIDTDDSEQE